MLLVLAWNASTWGAVFSYLSLLASEDPEISLLPYMGKTFFCILPHLVVEAITYVLIAMSGVFLSRAVTKYKILSDEFSQVGEAVLNILVMGAVLLIAASFLEGIWAPWAVELVFSP